MTANVETGADDEYKDAYEADGSGDDDGADFCLGGPVSQVWRFCV